MNTVTGKEFLDLFFRQMRRELENSVLKIFYWLISSFFSYFATILTLLLISKQGKEVEWVLKSRLCKFLLVKHTLQNERHYNSFNWIYFPLQKQNSATPVTTVLNFIQFMARNRPSPSLACCAILPTSFRGKGPHFSRWLVVQSSSDGGLLAVRDVPMDVQ